MAFAPQCLWLDGFGGAEAVAFALSFLAVIGGSSTRAIGVSYNEAAMRYLIAILALAGIFDSVLALRIHNQNPADAPP